MRARLPLLCALMVAGGALMPACASNVSGPGQADIAAAEGTLSYFLGMLANGDYAGAAGLYAGPLDSMQDWNREIDSQDVAGLLGYSCESRLLQCLPVRAIALAEIAPADGLVFHVEFSLADGSLFVRGPCCGATSTEMPNQSTFAFRVQSKAGGGFVVLDLPPYVP